MFYLNITAMEVWIKILLSKIDNIHGSVGTDGLHLNIHTFIFLYGMYGNKKK